MTNEVERNLFYVLVISGIWTKKMRAPKNVFDVVQRRNNELQRDTKIIVEAFWQRKIFYLEIVKYLYLSKCLTTDALTMASVDWQAVNQTDWHSFLGFTNGISIRVYTLKAISQIQLYWELHIFCPIWSNFYGKGVINWGGWPISPLKDPKHKPVCLFQFWDRPFKLAKFHENRRDGM